MKGIIILCLATFTVISCNKFDGLPECIQSKIEESKDKDLRAVKKFVIGAEDMYFFNTGATEYDGAEFIYNSSCDTVCLFCGFCGIKECLTQFPEYNSEEWEIVWKK